MKNKTKSIVITFASIILVAVLGSVFSYLGMKWFDSLNKPTQWIPDIVIPIVWTVIYLCFAVILFLWQKNQKLPIFTKILLILNGILNILWCLMFFTLNLTLVGNIIIILNLVAGFWLVIDITEYKPIYGYILIIYPIWLCIATGLNIATWILN